MRETTTNNNNPDNDLSKELIPHSSNLSSACVQPSTAFRGIFLLERCGCPGASGAVPANSDSSAISSGPILPRSFPLRKNVQEAEFPFAFPCYSLGLLRVHVCCHAASRCVERNFPSLFLVTSLGLHRAFVSCHPVSRCAERNFPSLFLVAPKRRGC